MFYQEIKKYYCSNENDDASRIDVPDLIKLRTTSALTYEIN